MKLGVHGKPFGEELVSDISDFLNTALQNGELFISESFNRSLLQHNIKVQANSFRLVDEPGDLNAFITFGGDGTILEAVAHIAAKETPVLGINTGRLGFLSETSSDQMAAAFSLFLKKRFSIDKRMMLHLETSSDVFDIHLERLDLLQHRVEARFDER